MNDVIGMQEERAVSKPLSSVSMGSGPLYDHNLGGYPPPSANTSGLEPAGRAVLVKPYEVKLSTTIAIPDISQERMDLVEQRAVVIAIGESCWHDEPCARAKVGDHVLVTRFAGWPADKKATADGESYRLVNDRDIFCRISKENQK